MTYRQLIYIILDEVKLISGDSILNEDHVKFLIDKYRPYILKQYYDSLLEKEIPDTVYQDICLDLESVNTSPCDSSYQLKSIQKIPNLIGIGNTTVTPMNYLEGINIAYVSKNRIRFVGNNKWMKNIIYCAIGPDNYLYLKSSSPQFTNLEKVRFSGIFEDASQALELSCDCKCNSEAKCDELDEEFPFEEFLYPQLTELVLKEMLGAAYRPHDNENNAKDDLADMNQYIRSNMKRNFIKNPLYNQE